MTESHKPAAPEAPRNERIGGERARITEMAEIPRLLPGELDRLRIVHPLMKDTGVLESFQRLLGRLEERSYGKNFVVGVCGVVPGAGSSFVSLNLAAAIALDHHRTALLVEGGPDNPVMRTLLMLPPDYGVGDYLADPGLDIEAIIYSSRIPRLRVVPWGRAHAESRPLHSAPLQQLLATARARYSDRFVVLDVPGTTPPDALRRLSHWCDFMLLVVPYGQTSASQVRAVAESIGRDRLVGVVLNRDPAP